MKKYLLLCFFSLSLTAALCCFAPAAGASGGSYYFAAENDSIAAIAEARRLDSELVAAINDLAVDEPLPLGKKILLPEQPAVAVTIAAGDTLTALAARYQTSVEALAIANDIQRTDLIYAGSSLLIPLDEEISSYGESLESPRFLSVAALASRSSEALLRQPAIGQISSRYGERARGWHCGLDIAADVGAPIYAAAAGIVVEAGWKNDAYGNTLIVDHGNNMLTLYAHADELYIEAGRQVYAGQIIAAVGETGNATGPHLHFEVRIGGECVDPLAYLR